MTISEYDFGSSYKRTYTPSEGSSGIEDQDARKRHKPSHYSDVVSQLTQVHFFSQVSQEKEGNGNATSAVKWRTECSERVFSDSQEKLRKVFGRKKFRNLKEKFNFQESGDSDEEDEGNKKPEDPKEHEGFELTRRAFRATLLKPVA